MDRIYSEGDRWFILNPALSPAVADARLEVLRLLMLRGPALSRRGERTIRPKSVTRKRKDPSLSQNRLLKVHPMQFSMRSPAAKSAGLSNFPPSRYRRIYAELHSLAAVRGELRDARSCRRGLSIVGITVDNSRRSRFQFFNL